MQQVIAFTGLPGTGKSTLAERLATDLAIPAFAGDWLLGALKPHGVLTGLTRPAFLAMYIGGGWRDVLGGSRGGMRWGGRMSSGCGWSSRRWAVNT